MAAPIVSLREFLPLVLPYVTGCAEIVATYNLRLSAIEFCERTLCWRHVTTQDLAANGEAVVCPDYATIHKFERVRFGEVDLTPIAFTDVPHSHEIAQGFPEHVTQVNDNTITVLPFQPGTLNLSLFLKPRFGSNFTHDDVKDQPMQDYYDQVPAFLLHQHGETIALGALGRLLNQPAASYFNPAKANSYAKQFRERATEKFSEGLRGQQRAKLRTRTVWF